MVKRVPVIIKSHHGPLKMLAKARKQNFNLILKNTPRIGQAIRALFKLILDPKGPLETKHTKKLKKHKLFIRKIAKAQNKNVVPHVQKGGSIFKTILGVALPLLSGLL